MATVGLIGTLDTKEDECRWLAKQVKAAGCDTPAIDTGGFSVDNGFADIEASQVASAASYAIEELRERRVRGDMIEAMASGAAVIVPQLVADGAIDGVVGLGGSGGSSGAARDAGATTYFAVVRRPCVRGAKGCRDAGGGKSAAANGFKIRSGLSDVVP